MKILAGFIVFAVLLTFVLVIASLIFRGRYLSDVKAAFTNNGIAISRSPAVLLCCCAVMPLKAAELF